MTAGKFGLVIMWGPFTEIIVYGVREEISITSYAICDSKRKIQYKMVAMTRDRYPGCGKKYMENIIFRGKFRVTLPGGTILVIQLGMSGYPAELVFVIDPLLFIYRARCSTPNIPQKALFFFAHCCSTIAATHSSLVTTCLNHLIALHTLGMSIYCLIMAGVLSKTYPALLSLPLPRMREGAEITMRVTMYDSS